MRFLDVFMNRLLFQANFSEEILYRLRRQNGITTTIKKNSDVRHSIQRYLNMLQSCTVGIIDTKLYETRATRILFVA